MPYANIFKRIEYEKLYRQRNKEKLRLRARNHYLKNSISYKKRAFLQRLKDPKKRKETDRLYYQRKKEKIKERMRQNYWKNRDKVLLRVKSYRSQNKEVIKRRNRTYYIKNKARVNERNRAYHIKNRHKMIVYKTEYRLKNKAKLNEGQRQYYKKNPEAHLARLARQRLIKILGGQKPKGISVVRLFGCTLPSLRRHIERQFKRGMNWGNRGKVWHLDHIVPIAHFQDKLEANHFSNLRPMFAEKNIQKGAKVAGFFVFRGKRLVQYTP